MSCAVNSCPGKITAGRKCYHLLAGLDVLPVSKCDSDDMDGNAL